MLYEQLTRLIPPSLARERIVAWHRSRCTCAPTAPGSRTTHDGRRHVPADVFIENLVDMVTAAVFAPLSEGAQAAASDPKAKANGTSRRKS